MIKSYGLGTLPQQGKLPGRFGRSRSAVVKAQDGYRGVNGYNYSGNSKQSKDWDNLAAEDYSSVEPFFPEYKPTAVDTPPSYTPPNVDRREPNYPDYTKDIDSLVGYSNYSPDTDRFRSFRQNDDFSTGYPDPQGNDTYSTSYQDSDRYSSLGKEQYSSGAYGREGSLGGYSATSAASDTSARGQTAYQSSSFVSSGTTSRPSQPSVEPAQGSTGPADQSGSAPELINGRLAMVGFLGAMAAELASGEPIYYQLWDATTPIILTIISITVASMVPIMRGVRYGGVGFMTPTVELINARAAMIGIALMFIIEMATGRALFVL